MKRIVTFFVSMLLISLHSISYAKIVTLEITGKVTEISDQGFIEQLYPKVKIGSKIIAVVRYDTKTKHFKDEEDTFIYKINNEYLITLGNKYTLAHFHKYFISLMAEMYPGGGSAITFYRDNNRIYFINDVENVIWSPYRLPEKISLADFPDQHAFLFRWLTNGQTIDVRGNVTKIKPIKTYICPRFLSSMVIERKSKKIIPLKFVFHDENGKRITSKSLSTPPVIQVFRVGSGGDVGKFIQECSLLKVKGSAANRLTYKGSGVWTYMLNTSKYPDPGTYNIRILTGNMKKYVIDQPKKSQFRRK
jgi:hypothetical protein